MNFTKRLWGGLTALLMAALIITGCGSNDTGGTDEGAGESEAGATQTLEPSAIPATPTATPTRVVIQADNACHGLSGSLEMQVVVGPAEAAGLEPVAVGEMPFQVVGDQPPYSVEGGGQISYSQTLNKEWGTYQVTMQMDSDLGGECEGTTEGGTLHTSIDMSGEQLLKVDAGEFQGEYPWSGSQHFDLDFPLEEGATAQGEGWSFVLHLD